MPNVKVKHTNIEKLKSQLARALADYDNLRKRAEQDRLDSQRIINSITVGKLIGIWDSLLNLQKHNKDQGLEIILKNYKDLIEDLGAEEIKVDSGEEFNPVFHEVSEVVENSDKNLQNKIAGVILTGWKLRDSDFVIRPVKVRVYVGVVNK
ncbi:nucleotide exchange factor GrpE [Candidatus Woesebacteria bacterium]|nr:nucleotide exchange factor GrpE [Candidatus Woesebacteria bacterium]